MPDPTIYPRYVDIVIERGPTAVAGVEVKAGATVRSSDFRGLRKLKKITGDRFASGVVLYDGETATRFGEGLYAIPIRQLWETPYLTVGELVNQNFSPYTQPP